MKSSSGKAARHASAHCGQQSRAGGAGRERPCLEQRGSGWLKQAGRASSSSAPCPPPAPGAALPRASSRRCFIPLPSPYLQRVFQQRHFGRNMPGAFGAAQQSRLIPTGRAGSVPRLGERQRSRPASHAQHCKPAWPRRKRAAATRRNSAGAAQQVQQSRRSRRSLAQRVEQLQRLPHAHGRLVQLGKRGGLQGWDGRWEAGQSSCEPGD